MIDERILVFLILGLKEYMSIEDKTKLYLILVISLVIALFLIEWGLPKDIEIVIQLIVYIITII